MDEVGVAAGILALAFVVESMVEYFVGFLGESKKYVAAVLGVGIALAFKVNLLLDIFGLGKGNQVAFWAGVVLSGLIIGRGSNWLHDFYTKFIMHTP